MKIVLFTFSLIYLLTMNDVALSQDKEGRRLAEEVGIGVSFNGTADEVVLGINFYAEHNIVRWRNGRFFSGLSAFYGTYPNTSKSINRYTKGRTSLIYPIHVLVGHQFQLFNNRLLLRSTVSAGPSIFKQKITLDDDRFDLNETYRFTDIVFTIHSKIGAAVRIGKNTNLELYANLPVVNTKIAPFGFGLAMNKTFR